MSFGSEYFEQGYQDESLFTQDGLVDMNKKEFVQRTRPDGSVYWMPVKQAEPVGYHKRTIQKGDIGSATKICEEYDEWLDAHEQQNKVMELVELSDLLGAIEAYTVKHFNIDLDVLTVMTRATQRAFKSGHRK